MADLAPRPLRADDFTTRVRAVQVQLASSAARAGLKDDPYAHVVEAQSAVLDVLADVVAEVRTGQPPAVTLDTKQFDELKRACAAGIYERAEQLSIDATNRRASQLMMWAGGIAVACLALGLGAGWYTWGRTAPPVAPTLGCLEQPNGGLYCGVWIDPATGAPVKTTPGKK
jgi:hypothetical protein